jgi:hypothetical protein
MGTPASNVGGKGGAGGTASGATIVLTGVAGGNGAYFGGSSPTGGKGGSSPNGGAGGKGGVGGTGSGGGGYAPGGGGGGAGGESCANFLDGTPKFSCLYSGYAGGGGGGYAKQIYSQGDLTPGSAVTIVVGIGGGGTATSSNEIDGNFGTVNSNKTSAMGAGAPGEVLISGPTTATAPTPTVTITGNGKSGSITVTPGQEVDLLATFTPPGSYTLDAINDNKQNALTSQDSSPSKSYAFNTTANPATSGASYPFTAAVEVNGSWANNFGQIFTVNVTAPPAGTCSDIPGNPTVAPTGCNTPPPTGTGPCVPTNDTFTGGQCVPALVAPTCTITPATQNVPLGSQPTLNYTITGTATEASINEVPVPDGAGNQTYTPPAPASNTQYFLVVQNASGQNTCGPAQVNITNIPGTITSPLTATPIRVQKGQPTSLSWATSHMQSCGLLQNGVVVDASVPLSATGFASPNVLVASTFTLSCSDGTNTKTSSVSVTILPSFKEI